MTVPPGALTWSSPAERNRKLMPWRRAVLSAFGESARCLRVAWVLDHLFNAKLGYAHPSNAYLADATGMRVNKAQGALATLETGGAILRGYVTHNGQPRRVIYPATALIPRPTAGQWATPTAGEGRDPQEPGVLNLRRSPRLPKSEYQRAKLAAEIAERRRSQRLAASTAEALEREAREHQASAPGARAKGPPTSEHPARSRASTSRERAGSNGQQRRRTESERQTRTR